jgi:hypothetical protein
MDLVFPITGTQTPRVAFGSLVRVTPATLDGETFLTVSENFQVREIEVFEITD